MISINAKYFIWFTLVFGYNTPKIKRMINLYPDIKDFYNKRETEARLCGLLSNSEIDKLNNTPLKHAENIIDKSIDLGYDVISIDDPLYPECLRQIYAPPAVIYINGKLPDLDNRLSIAIIGTRKASVYGIKMSYDIAYNLSKSGTVVISGGALGIDCASHKGVLQADGITVCVLGCGINSNYLAENAQMRKTISSRGAVISEYPPDTEPKPYNFPARNRIISALSNGVLIIEAGLKSGSLITANCAIEQGKDVFAVMANINSPLSKGSNALIRDGAIPVCEYTDILNNYNNLYAIMDNVEEYVSEEEEIMLIPVKGNPPTKINNKSTLIIEEKTKTSQKDNKHTGNKIKIKHRENLDLSEESDMLYHILSDRPAHIDDILIKAKMPVHKALQILTELELLGLIEGVQGRQYKIV